ncbi:MAG: hypothetical protein ACYC56_05040 [Candidatus Aquicultor sp.]
MKQITSLVKIFGGLSFGLIMVPVFVIVPAALIILGLSHLIEQFASSAPIIGYLHIPNILVAFIVPSAVLLAGLLRR